MTFSTLILIGKHGQVSRHKEMLHVPEQTIQWCSMMELCMYLQATMGEQDTMTYGSALWRNKNISGSRSRLRGRSLWIASVMQQSSVTTPCLSLAAGMGTIQWMTFISTAFHRIFGSKYGDSKASDLNLAIDTQLSSWRKQSLYLVELTLPSNVSMIFLAMKLRIENGVESIQRGPHLSKGHSTSQLSLTISCTLLAALMEPGWMICTISRYLDRWILRKSNRVCNASDLTHPQLVEWCGPCRLI